MPSQYDLLLEPLPEKSPYDDLLTSESSSPYDQLLETDQPASTLAATPSPTPFAVQSAPAVQENQAIPTALPGPPPGTYPDKPIRQFLGEVLDTITGIPARAIQSVGTPLGGLVTGDIFTNPEPYLSPPTDEDIDVLPVSGKTLSHILAAPIGGLPQGTGGFSGALGGLIEGVGQGGASLLSPRNLAQLPFGIMGKVGQRVIAGVFEGQALMGTPEQWEAFKNAPNTREKFKIGTEMGLGLAIPAAAFAHTFKGKGVEMTPELIEAAKIPAEVTERPIAEPVRPVTELAEAPTGAVLSETPVLPETAVSPEAMTPTARIAAAQRDLAAARQNGDANGITRATDELNAVATELIGGQTKARETAQADLTTDATVNPIREVTPETLLDPRDTEMVKAAADAEGLRYDGIQEGVEGQPSGINITNPKTGDTYTMPEGSTVADLRAKIAEKEIARATPLESAELVRESLDEVRPADDQLARIQDLESQVQEALAKAGEEYPEQALLALTEGRKLTPDQYEQGLEKMLANSDKAVRDRAAIENEVVREKEQGVAEIMSPGPGAASVKEKLASYELRRFGERFQQDQSIDPAIREQTGNRYYEPISNKVTLADAEAIIEKRGTDESVRLVRDEDFPMQPRVRVTMGEALVKKLNQSYREATAAGDIRATEFLEQAVDTAEYLSGYGTTLGQGVQAFAIWNKLSPEGRLLEATRMAKKSGIELTPEQQKKIGELNAEIEKAPEGFQKTEKTQDLMSYMSEIKGIDPSAVPIALWYSNILSGFSTQLVNTLDTGLNVFSESAAMAASHPTAVPSIIAGLYRGMIKGGFEAANVLKTGRSVNSDKILQQRILERVQFGKEGGVPINTDTVLGRFLKSAFESKAAKPLNLWKYPLRAMVASDTIFFNSFKEARARLTARALAKSEGLSGPELLQRIQDVLNRSPETLDAALKQAQDEKLTGLNQRRRVQEIIEQGRSEDLVSSATEAAEIATYNHEPTGVIGLVAQNIANITEGFPLAKAIVPFTRIVANVTNRGLNYTPWGYKRLFFGEWGGKKFGTEPPTGEGYRTQLVKATLGTTAMTTLALLDANDTVQITAGGPDNNNEKRQLQNAGWKPYSVKIGDGYYSYQYTPFNLGFAMVGHYRDAVRYNKLSEKDASTRLAYGMLKSASTIFDMSFLSGISDFIETVQGTTSSTKGASRLFSRTASSILIPNLVKQIDKLFDPTVYQSDTITQSLIRETPVARGELLKPMLNVLGEPIKPSQNRFFTFDTKDPVWQLIVEKQAWVPVPSKTTKIQNRAITPDEYYRLIEESGPLIREYIQSNLGRLREMTGEEAQETIQKESQRIRKNVKSGF